MSTEPQSGNASSDDDLPSLSSPPAGPRLDRALRAVPPAVAALGLGTLVLTIAARVATPWPLEWMEGAIVHHALRLSQLQPLYLAPSAEFVPYLYPPLGYLPMALAAPVFGSSLPAARIACLLCTVAALIGIARIGARAGGTRTAGMLGAGLFALGYGYGGAFMDIARIDLHFIALVVWGAERIDAGRERSGLWLLALSALAKQHGLVLFAAAALAMLIRDRTRSLSPVLWPASTLLLVGQLLQWSSGGWFGFYTFELPARHGVIPPLLLSFLLVDLLVLVPVLTIGAVIWLWRRRAVASPPVLLLLAALLVSALGRAHAGGHDNVRLPALALLCAWGIGPVLRALLDRERSRRARLAALVLVAIQCAILWQPPSSHAPRAAHAARFGQLRAELIRCAAGGRAVAFDHALLTPTPFVHTMALSDLSGGGSDAVGERSVEVLLAVLSGPDAPAAIAIGARFPALEAVLAERYEPCGRVQAPPMPTGYQPKSQELFVRKRLHAPP